MSDSYFKLLLGIVAIGLQGGCTSSPQQRSDEFAYNSDASLIENPFAGYGYRSGAADNITLRTKRGDKAVEVELPQSQGSELHVPMNPNFTSEVAANPSGLDYQYVKERPSIADREIASTFNKNDDPVADAKRQEIENALGLQQSDELPSMDESYLAKIDVIKQMFHRGRFEATLLEIDRLIKMYPTNAKLYEMRGTVLDRLGYGDLAIKSWTQALEFEPESLSLRRLVEKKQAQRNVASEKK